ncbi:TonB-dependent receptor [Parvibium lacunae]|uniref:TonB-dependent receptor n=1 Tax=Parvibium lacunae TaxID=1888893 RepID=A0A368L8M9_9BURK|nr:TonB-dependent receptor [Parvibium lacunae]
MVNWQAIPLAQIERIEILRGPASSLYGADALGGVVQIITKRPERGQQAYLEGRAGRWGTVAGEAGASYANQQLDLRVGTHAGRSAGYDTKIRASTQPDRDGYWQEGYSTGLGWKFNAAHQLRFQAAQNRLVSEIDTSGPSDRRFTSANQSDWWGLQSQHQFKPITVRTTLGETVDNYWYQPSQSRYLTRQRQIGIDSDWRITPHHTLTGGLSYLDEQVGVSDYLQAPKARTTESAQLGYLYRQGGHRWQLNGRHDDASQYGNRLTGSGSYGYQFTPQWRVYGSYGTAFRAPSFNDLYYPGFDNPNLQPEYARNKEVGLQYGQGDRLWRLTAFENNVSNLIAFSGSCPLAGRPFGCPQNVSRARIRGYSLQWQESLTTTTRLSASYDWQDPEDMTTGNRLARRAMQQAKLNVTQQLGRQQVGLEMLAVGSRFDELANRNRLGGYTLVNVSWNIDLKPSWSIFARLNNALDKPYETARDFQTPRRNLMLGVRLTL